MNKTRPSKEVELPPCPIEPDPYECCGRGCDPCIFDYYEKALARWERRVAELQQRGAKKLMIKK